MDQSRTTLLGIPFDNLTEQEVLARVEKKMKEEGQFYITTPNPEFVLEAQTNERFRKALQNADLSIPDGTGILWAATFLNQKRMGLIRSLMQIPFDSNSIRKVLKERVTGTDLMEKLVAQSERTGWKIFLLGGSAGIAEGAKKVLLQKYPKANIVGYFAGDGKSTGDSETVKKVSQAKPEIVFVAYGAPKQEAWIERNLGQLPSVQMAMGVGGAFDFISGKVKRAPGGFQKAGLEWLWRLLKEPKRAKRIRNATVKFIRLIAEEKKLKP